MVKQRQLRMIYKQFIYTRWFTFDGKFNPKTVVVHWTARNKQFNRTMFGCFKARSHKRFYFTRCALRCFASLLVLT